MQKLWSPAHDLMVCLCLVAPLPRFVGQENYTTSPPFGFDDGSAIKRGTDIADTRMSSLNFLSRV